MFKTSFGMPRHILHREVFYQHVPNKRFPNALMSFINKIASESENEIQ